MRTSELRPRAAGAESGAEAVRFGAEYRKQQMAMLRDMRVGKQLSVSYSMKHSFR